MNINRPDSPPLGTTEPLYGLIQRVLAASPSTNSSAPSSHRHTRSLSSSLRKPALVHTNSNTAAHQGKTVRKASFPENPVMQSFHRYADTYKTESELDYDEEELERARRYKEEGHGGGYYTESERDAGITSRSSMATSSIVPSSLDYTLASTPASGFRYATTPSAPSVSTYGAPMRTIRSRGRDDEGESVSPRARGCMGAAHGIWRRCKKGVRSVVRRFPISVSVEIKRREEEKEKDEMGEMTIRIKNNKVGGPVFEVSVDEYDNEQVLPIANLKALFPHSSSLRKSLIAWNRHYQQPPPHWLINFVPKAYLRRGYYLAEEVCEYFLAHPDGRRYRIEYEPIGHAWCLVGTIIPRPKKIRRERNPSRVWERRDE